MENWVFNKRWIQKYTMISLIPLILLKVILFILNTVFDLYLLIFDQPQYVYGLILNLLIVILVMILITCRVNPLLKILLNFSAIGLISVLIFLRLLFSSNESYFYFVSPNQTHTLVIEEKSFLLGGWSDTYVRKGIFIQPLTFEISTDDGHRPFS